MPTATRGKKNATVTSSRNLNEWFVAVVARIVEESPMVKSFFFTVPFTLTHKAGQHYELRLTAENGYQAARLYSAAAPATNSTELELSIMDVKGGEVSPYITEQLKVGDEVEIRGPFGKFFTWQPEVTRPVLLIGGGSGVVPLRSIYKAHADSTTKVPMRLLYSARHYDDILYKNEFVDNPDVFITLTQETSTEWQGSRGRISLEMVAENLKGLENPICFICGMSPFVDAASSFLLEQGIPASDIKTERFG
jgi:ferredoxin-NADP reductase